MVAKSRLEGAVQKDNYNSQASKSNIATASFGAKRTQGHKKSQSIQLERSLANQLAQKANGGQATTQLTGFGNSRNYDVIAQKSSHKVQKSVGRPSRLDKNQYATSKTQGTSSAITPNKTRTRNDAVKVGVRDASQSASKLSLGNKAKSSGQYNSVSKSKNISPPKKPIQYSLDLSESKL
jgi:hypothetical protein